MYELKGARGPKVRPGQERDPSSSNCSSLMPDLVRDGRDSTYLL